MELDSKIAEGLPFEPTQQDAILGFVVLDHNFMMQVKDRIQSNWFVDGWTGKVYDLWVKFFTQFGHPPKSDDEFFLSEGVYVQGPMERAKIKNTLIRARAQTNNFSLDVLQSALTGWLQSRIYHKYVSHSATLFNNRKFTEAKAVLTDAVKELQEISFEGKPPADFTNPRGMIEQIQLNLATALTLGHPVLDRVGNPDSPKGSLLKGDSTIFLAPTNVGKCLSPSTPVMLADATVVRADSIRAGDKLMGPDGKSRNVLSTTQGTGPMFRIVPKNGSVPFECNDVHVLSLKKMWGKDKGQIVNIPLDEYLAKSDNWKRQHGLWRAGLDFQTQNLPIEPYVLGSWLGDGHSSGTGFTNTDPVLKQLWRDWIESNGDGVRTHDISEFASPIEGRKTKTFAKLKQAGLIDNKHIPHIYLTSSRSQRLELLAGLLDTDVYLGESHYFEITQKNKTLADQIAFLCRSLGFKVNSSEVEKGCQTGTVGRYTRITISGNIAEIPTKLQKKQAANGAKAPDVTGFTVEALGQGDYYGFTLDGDHLFLLGDFTVTHNTTLKITTICANLWAGRSVIFMTHEGRKLDIMEKIWCCMLNMTKGEYRAFVMSDRPEHLAIIQQVAKLLSPPNFIYIDYQKPGTTVEEVVSVVRQHQQRRKAKTGSGFDMLANDYPAILGADGTKGIKMERRQRDAYVYRYFVDYAGEQEMHGLFSIQSNREGSKKNRKAGEHADKSELVILEDVQEAYEVTNSATNLWTINRSPQDQARDIITLLNCKSRSSEVNVAVTLRSAFRRCRTHWADLPATWYKGTNHLDQLDSLLQSYNNKEIPFNYKALQNDSTKS